MFKCKIEGIIIFDEDGPQVVARRELTLPFVPRKKVELVVDGFPCYADDVVWQHDQQLFEIGFKLHIGGETLEEFVELFEGTEWKYEIEP